MAKKVLNFAKDVAKGIAKDLTTKTDKSGGKDSFNDTRRQSMQRTKRSERVKAGKPTTGKKVKTTFDKKYGASKSASLQKSAAKKAPSPKKTVAKAKKLYDGIEKAKPKKTHDFDWGKVDSVNEWKREMPDIAASLSAAYDWGNRALPSPTSLGPASAGLIGSLHDEMSTPVFRGYDAEEGFDIDGDSIFRKAILSTAFSPYGKALPAAKGFGYGGPVTGLGPLHGPQRGGFQGPTTNPQMRMFD